MSTMTNTMDANAKKEHALVLMKPDMFDKEPDILQIIYNSGLELEEVCRTVAQLPAEKWSEFYQSTQGEWHHSRNNKFMASKPVLVCVIRGIDAIAKLRKLAGATDPKKAEKGTIRNQFGTELPMNAIHVSDSTESYKREVLFFWNSNIVSQW